MKTGSAFCVSIATLAMFAAGCPKGPVMKPDADAPITSVPDLAKPAACGAHDVPALMACVSGKRLEADTRAVAHPRAPGSAHHEVVRADCEKRFAELGFETRVFDYGTGINVVGHKLGFSKPQQLVVVGAHYDQAGECAGADDNGSGVAALLEAARVLATARFDRTLVVACWDEGERGQLGSVAHARDAHAHDADIKLAVSFEAVGFASDDEDSQHVPEGFEQVFPDQALALLDNDYRANFLMVVAESATESWAKRVVAYGSTVELQVHVLTLTERMKVKQRDLHRSDHVSFWDQSFPAMLVTDSGPFRNDRIGCNKAPDEADTLSFPFATRATQAAVGAIAEALELR